MHKAHAVIIALALGEVASTARSLGCEVSVVDVAAVPLERVLGREVGEVLAARYRAYGVDLRLGGGLAGLVAGRNGRVRALELADGSRLACDAALLAVGVAPAVELHGDARGGIETDACGRTALHAIFGRERPYDVLPYFWSDGFGLRLQHVGHAHEWATVELEGDETSFAACYPDRAGRPLAGLLANRPREVGLLRRELAGAARREAA